MANAVNYNVAMSDNLGPEPSDESIKSYISNTLRQGLILPGYGHALLACRDPRFDMVSRFVDQMAQDAKSEVPTNLVKLAKRASALAPRTLTVIHPDEI
jgi:citrate synthase